LTASRAPRYDAAYTRALSDLAIVAIIPARFSSSRLPGKPLSDIHGKSMIQRVYERVLLARRLNRVLVATDDDRIAAAVRGFGGEAVMTSREHRSGTDRLAEVAAQLQSAEIVVNVQGDEPLLDPEGIEAAIEALRDDPGLPVSTLSVPIGSTADLLSSSVVKVVCDMEGNALYFSRLPIPFVQVEAGSSLQAAEETVRRGLARKHVGLYAFRRDALLRFAGLPRAPLEIAEGLEQLRALHHGMRIRVVPRERDAGVAVDTPDDLARVRQILAGETVG
jgi:3-deoxy-manno-octulosonate cytidylyltransferase (CMP-KDO synthetase)